MAPTSFRLAPFAASSFARFTALIMASKRRVSAGVCHSTPEGLSSIRSAKVVFRDAGSGSDHQIQFFRTFAGALSSAVRNPRVCQSGDAAACVSAAGISTSPRTPIMNRRGRECGTNSAASITTAPKTYPAFSKFEQIAAKSLPSCEVSVPQTFSSAMMRGGRPSAIRSFIKLQNGQNVPDRSPFNPAPPPASERSWQGNDAQARSTAPGKSLVVSVWTSAVLRFRRPSCGDRRRSFWDRSRWRSGSAIRCQGRREPSRRRRRIRRSQTWPPPAFRGAAPTSCSRASFSAMAS